MADENIGNAKRHDLTSEHDGQRTLPFELAPLEQQAGGNAFLPRHQRHAHAGFVGAPHQG